MIFHQHSSGILILVVRMGGLRYLLRLRLHEPTVHDQQVQMYDWSAEDEIQSRPATIWQNIIA